MANGPELQGDLLSLRPFSRQHLTPNYVSWLQDSAVTRYSEQRHRTHSLETCEAYLSSFETSPNLLWAICDRERDLHVGNLTANIDQVNDLADISILIGDPATQGRGFGKEAWGLALDYLSNTLGIRKVTGGCMATNLAMVRVMESYGMQPDGHRVQHYLMDGEPVDIVYFAQFNPVKS